MAEESGEHNESGGFVPENVLQSHRVMLSRPATPPVAVTGLPSQAVFADRRKALTGRRGASAVPGVARASRRRGRSTAAARAWR